MSLANLGPIACLIFNSNQIDRLLVCPILYSNEELVKAVLLLVLVIKLTAELQKVSKELDCKGNVPHYL